LPQLALLLPDWDNSLSQWRRFLKSFPYSPSRDIELARW
jgi:hypothetical protein